MLPLYRLSFPRPLLIYLPIGFLGTLHPTLTLCDSLRVSLFNFGDINSGCVRLFFYL